MGSSQSRRTRRRTERANKTPRAVLPIMALPARGTVDAVVTVKAEVARLDACLESLRAELPASATLMVADVVREALPDAAKRREELALVARRHGATVVRHARGQWDARNRAAAAGGAPLLLFLDGDAVLAHGAWGNVAEDMAREDIGVLGGMLLWAEAQAKSKAGSIKWAGFTFGARLMPYARLEGWLPDNPKVYFRDDLQAVPSTIMVTRRTTFRSLRGFDPLDNFKGLCFADAEYCLRARAHGSVVAFEPRLCAAAGVEPFSFDKDELRLGGQMLLAIARHLTRFDEYLLL